MFPPFRPRLRAAAPALALAVTLAAASGAGAAPARRSAPPVRTGLETLEAQVQTFTLPNGLRFIVVERHQAPVFSYFTVVNAGSADEVTGITGLAHMMEHMAFKGTTVVGTTDARAESTAMSAEERAWDALVAERRRGARADTVALARLDRAFRAAQLASNAYVVSNEPTRLIEEAGGQNINAFTAADITAYFYSLPSNRLEFWASMHAGIFTRPVFREFYKERDVVIEERRMNYESSPIGRLYLEFVQAAFNAHPYGYGGIGHTSDLRSFSRSEGETFFRTHYVAKNMVIAVVGDVTLAGVRRLADTYFAGISDATPPPPVDTVEPEQRAERRVILEEASQPMMFIGWHIPAASDPAYATYRALADLLAGGRTSRLYKALVKERKIATQVAAFTGDPGEKYPNLLTLQVVPASGQDPLEVERQVYAVIDSIRTARPFTDDELAAWKVRVKARKIGQADDNSNLAGELAQAEVLYGGWREFFREQERIQAMRSADVTAALGRTLLKHNRTVALIVNPAAATNAGGR